MHIKTNISFVYGSDGEALEDTTGSVSLFDRLFGGGLVIPDSIVEDWVDRPERCTPVVLLISGPAGTGKTTLAMELVYRLSEHGIPNTSNPESPHHFPSLYFSSESPGQLLVRGKVRALGWDQSRFVDASDGDNYNLRPDGGTVLVVGKDAAPFHQAQTPTAYFQYLENYCEYIKLTARLKTKPGVLVIDSLNVLPPGERGKHFLNLMYHLRGPFLVAVILDTASDEVSDPFWTFAVDTVIRLSQTERKDPRVGTYLLGEFRIAKARWQKHALGSHQVKIFGNVDERSVHSPPGRREHFATGHLPPFRRDGGIQLYQSVHRHLSDGQQLADVAEVNHALKFDSCGLPALDNEIGGGFPVGRCTALVGDRGALKSHLAYLWLLSAAARGTEPVLLLSLRDDETEALSRLNAIHRIERPGGPVPADLIETGRLRVVHFRPGYIAPDEFLFRLWFHVHDFKPRRVVIASLEQLDALFPLCSVEPVFVPSMLDLLNAAKITTVAIGVSGGNQPPTQYGLLPQSSLILSFTADTACEPGRVRLRVSRLPTAQPSGRGGWIYLDNASNQLRFAPGDAPVSPAAGRT